MRQQSKVDYVLFQGKGNATTQHTCHWPGCDKVVPPAMWGCKKHWFKLPEPIRLRIWRTYRPGQEITKTPSAAYIDAAREASDWVAANFPTQERLL